MKLTKVQQEQLITLGLQKLLDMVNVPKPKARAKIKDTRKMKWSEARKKKFAKAMRARWRKLKD